jgi:S-formylglutathione hydrolase FrmB
MRLFRWIAGVCVLVLAAGTMAAASAQPVIRADDGARVIAETWLDARTAELTIDSPALGTQVNTRLLVPEGWSTRADWPVLYLLHGCCASYASWTDNTDVEALTKASPVLVVMPEAGEVGFYSDWWNHGQGGAPAWETFHLTELRQLLERGYGAGKRRAIAGLSMGGFGTLSYAARHPGMFRFAASYSGVIDTRYHDDTFDGSKSALELVGSYASDAYALWGDPKQQAAIWAAHNPTDLAPMLRTTPVFVSCGNGQPGRYDPAGKPADRSETVLYKENVSFIDRARKAGVTVTTDLYGPGTHTWPYWQRELHRSYPLIAKSLV